MKKTSVPCSFKNFHHLDSWLVVSGSPLAAAVPFFPVNVENIEGSLGDDVHLLGNNDRDPMRIPLRGIGCQRQSLRCIYRPSMEQLISLGGLAEIVLGIVADEMWAQQLLSIASWSLGAI